MGYINYYPIVKNLSQENRNNVYSALTKIRDKFQLSNTLKIKLPDLFSKAEEREVFLDVLKFLKENKVVLDFYREILPWIAPRQVGRQIGNTCDRLMIVQLHPENFQRFLEIIEKVNYSIGEKDSKLIMPSNSKWEDITIKLIDGHNVDIKVKDKIIRSDYKQMGFEDKKSRKPNQQWSMLQLLASKGGSLSWQESPSSKNINVREIEQNFSHESDEDSDDSQNKGYSILKAPDKVKKIKQLLSKSLKAFFKINEDPFLPYKQAKAYIIRIKLIPV